MWSNCEKTKNARDVMIFFSILLRLTMRTDFILCFNLVVSIDPEIAETFVRDVEDLYFRAKHSIEDTSVNTAQLTGIWIKMEAAVQHLKRMHWTLEISKPCSR